MIAAASAIAAGIVLVWLILVAWITRAIAIVTRTPPAPLDDDVLKLEDHELADLHLAHLLEEWANEGGR